MRNIFKILLVAIFLIGCSNDEKNGDEKLATQNSEVSKSAQTTKNIQNEAKKQELKNSADIIKEESNKSYQIIKDSVKNEANKTYNEVKDGVNKAYETAKEKTNEGIKNLNESANDAKEAIAVEFDKAKDKINDVKKDIGTDANKLKENIKEGLDNLADDINKTVAEVQKPLFNGKSAAEYFEDRCSSCHGRYGDLKALKASEVINKWDFAKIENALKGYKNGTYGGRMKATMAPTAKILSDEEIAELAKLIPTL